MEPLSLPIVRVTVLEDRAVIERRAEVTLKVGAQHVIITGLPAVAVDRSVQATLSSGTVVDARLVRRWQKEDDRPRDNPVLAQTIKDLEAQQRQLALRLERADARAALAAKAREETLRAISEAAGAGTGSAESWNAQLAAVNDALEQAELQRLAIRRDIKALARKSLEARAAQSQTAQHDQPLLTQAELNLEHPGGTATLLLRYLVPCAAWRPAYRAFLSRADAGESVKLECEGVVWQRTGEDWSGVELVMSTARPTLGATPPKLVEDWLYLREKTTQERQQVDVAVREETIQTTGEGAGATMSTVPGVDDGGETMNLVAAHKATVPSDGEPHRVPLFTVASPAKSELVATPERSPLVHRIARFDNTARSPLLAGPVELVRQSGYVGRGQLKFTAPGERVKLSFGSEDALRVARLEQTSEDSNLFKTRSVTHTVKLFVSNAGSAPANIGIDERIPVSEVESVEVKVLIEKSRPAPVVDKDGIARFDISAPPATQQELLFVWKTVSGSKVVGL